MQVSRVSGFFGSLINDFSWLRFFCGRLLDRLGNQLVCDFGFRVYTIKYSMHWTHEIMQGNAVNIQECMDKTITTALTMVQKGWFSAGMNSWFKSLLA